MKRITKSEIVITSILFLAIMLTGSACAASASTVLEDIPEPTPTIVSTALPSPIPTVEPTPEPRVISIDMNQSLKDNNTGGEIVFQNLTYTQNQNMALTFTISNQADYPITLCYPVYANINGYGLSFTGTEQYDFGYEAEPNTESSLTLIARLDNTVDRIMNIENIKSVQFNCTIAGKMGEGFQVISDEIINPNCPIDYVQAYNVPGDDVSILMEPEYYITGINNDIKVKSTYDDSEKKIYLTLIGTSIFEDSINGQIADFGKAHLAIDGIVVPTDDDVYTPDGEEIYLPNNGYCVISFDVSNFPGFVYQQKNLAFSFDMSYSPTETPYSYVSGVLQTGNNDIRDVSNKYEGRGEVWIDNNDLRFIFSGIGYDESQNFFIDGYLINKTKSNTIAAIIDADAKGMGIRFVSDPVPPNCAIQLHFIRYFFSRASLSDETINITVGTTGVGGKNLGEVTKKITLSDQIPAN